MKKLCKNSVVTFIFAAIIFGGIGVGATVLYNSNQILYNQSDSESEVTNVKEALDELYTKSFGGVELLHKGTTAPLTYSVPKEGTYLIVVTGSVCKSLDNNPASQILTIDGVATEWDYTSAQKVNAGGSEYFSRTYTAYKLVEVNSTIGITSNSYIRDYFIFKAS